MPIKTKSLQEISEKFVRKGGAAGQDYAAGVKNPKKDWQAETAAASGNYAAGVTAAIGRGAFATGVNKAGSAKWQRNAIAKGVTRYPAGVLAAKPDYEAGFGKYLTIIQGLDLPPRGPKGDPGNITRVSAIAAALHAAKVGG